MVVAVTAFALTKNVSSRQCLPKRRPLFQLKLSTDAGVVVLLLLSSCTEHTDSVYQTAILHIQEHLHLHIINSKCQAILCQAILLICTQVFLHLPNIITRNSHMDTLTRRLHLWILDVVVAKKWATLPLFRHLIQL